MKKRNNSFIILLFTMYLICGFGMSKIYRIRLEKINNEIVRSSKEVKIKYYANSELTEYPSHKNGEMEIINIGSNNFKKRINRLLDPYYYLKTSRLIDADIKKLKKVNKDTIGWIKIKNTKISFPFVQGKDNKYYLNHSYYGSKNSVGWLFMNHNNSTNFTDDNTIIYAKGNLKHTDFNELRVLYFLDWMEEGSGHVIKIATENESTSWQVVSIYPELIKKENIKTNYNKKEFNKFKNRILKKSIMNFKSDIDDNDKLLTLVVKYNDNYNEIIHAKLIKKINKQQY